MVIKAFHPEPVARPVNPGPIQVSDSYIYQLDTTHNLNLWGGSIDSQNGYDSSYLQAAVKLITEAQANALKAAKWDALIEACGHWQDGSGTIVKLYEDDATRTAIIKVGTDTGYKSYYREGCGFDAAITLLMEHQAATN